MDREFKSFTDDLFKKAKEHYNPEKKENPCLRKIKPKPLHLGTISVPVFYFICRNEFYHIDFGVVVPCSECLNDSDFWIPCKICNQTGENLVSELFGIHVKKCSQCKSEGWIRKSRCHLCKGLMRVNGTRSISFSVPKNYIIGSSISLGNCGNEGRNVQEKGIVTTFLCPEFPDLGKISDKKKKELFYLLNNKGIHVS